MREGIPKSVINRLKGLTATLSNFTTDPTNLANITDEDWTTVSGTGVRICTSDGEKMWLRYDLTVVRTVLLVGKIGIWVSAGSIYLYFIYSLDGTNWYAVAERPNASFNSTSERVLFPFTNLVRSRYVGIYLQNDAATPTMRAKFYEFAALEFRDFIGKN